MSVLKSSPWEVPGQTFSHDPGKDQKVEILLYEPMAGVNCPFLDLLHHCRQNDARRQGKCDDLSKPEESQEQGRKVGVLEIVDSEEVDTKLEQTEVNNTIVEISTKHGSNTLSSQLFMLGWIKPFKLQ